MLAGFESGRVALFRSFFPEDFAVESGSKRSLEEAYRRARLNRRLEPNTSSQMLI